MKARLFAVTVLLICFYGQASAQTYHIRVTQNTNLRASYSLQSGIAETVPAGTTLQVGGSFNRWLSISRNGEVWMADWVPYDRVESAQTPSDVNNCCFVDRQCATDQEWTDGYWAFQNNQCPVSPPATRQTSTQPSTTQPQSIDNCCFVDRQCTNDQEWTDGYWAMQNNQCGTPTPQVSIVAPPITTVTSDVDNCCHLGWSCQTDHEWERGFWNYQVGQCEHQGVIMEGSEQFKATMDAALRRLRERSQHWYWYTLDGLSKIREVTGNRIRVSSRGGDNRWGTDAYLGFGGNTASLGALLAHEACHVHRWRSGQNSGGVVGETACVQIEVQALDAIGPDSRRRNRLQYLLDNIHDPAVQWWHN